MTPQKQFIGFLSSVKNPGSLSTTVSSLTNAILSAAALFAVVKGLDTAVVTSQVQQIIDLIATAIPAALVVWHTLQAAFGLGTKLWYYMAAKNVVTVPAAVPTAVVETPVG